MRHRLSRMLKEPLLQFMLIGAALFAAYGLVAEPEPSAERDRIVVAAGDVERLASFFEKRRLRPPSAEELAGLVDEYVREEVLYREALALGLDRDDAVFRRLLRQKYEFLTQDLAVPAEPEPAALAAWYQANPERYRAPPRLSFTQVWFDTDRRGPAGEQEATLVLASLRAGADLADMAGSGDGSLMDPSYRDRTEPEVAALFGQEFADAVAALEPGIWSGPIRSGYGLHLVRVDARTDGEALPFEAVERQVRSDWTYEQRRQANDAIYARLLQRYDVVLEQPAGTATAPGGEGARQ